MLRIIVSALIAFGMLGAAERAFAQTGPEAERTFSIPALPLREALLRAGVQGGLSIDVSGSDRCGSSRGVNGRMRIHAALSRLTLGSGCSVVAVGPNAWRVVRQTPRRSLAMQHALAATEDVPTSVDEIIVTAPRSDDPRLSRAPYGISAVDGLELERTGTIDLSGMAGRVSGLTVTNLGPGRDKVFIRGMADGPVAGQTQALVGLYLDDVRLTYDAPDPALRLSDVERVEVLRGPQGALYGAGSMGGVIQVVSRAPDLSGFYGRGMVEVAQTRSGASGRTAELIMNLPIVPERLAVRAVGYDEIVGGYVDDLAQGISDSGEARRQGLRLSGLWRVSDGWTVRAGALAQTIHADDSHYATEGPAVAYGRRRSLREPNRNDFDGIWLSVEGDLGWARLKMNSSLQAHALDARYDATPAAGLFGLAGATAYDQADELSADVHEMRLEGRAGESLSWRAGLFFSEYNHQRVIAVTDAASGFTALKRQRRDHIDELAAFGDIAWALNNRLKVTAGARAFRLGVEHRSESTEPDATFIGDKAVVGVAPRLVVEYALDPVVFYVLAAEGYRGAGFNVVAPGGAGQPNRDVSSDEIVSAEAGARFTLMDRRLRGRVAAFIAGWSDIQSDRFDVRGLPFTANLGDGRNRGFEFEVEWRADGWTLDGHLVVNNPELTDPDPGFALDVDSRLPSVADFAVQAGVARRLDLGPAAIQSEFRVGYVGPTEVFLSPGVKSTSAGVLSSQLSATADVGRWSLRLVIDNVFGLSDDTFSFGNPFYPAGVIDTPQRPLNGRLALSTRF